MFHIGIATQHPPLPEPGQMSELGIDFIELCLTLDATRRPTANDLLQHPWLAPMQQQLSEHNSNGHSSGMGSGSVSNLNPLRSPGMTPDTGLTPDTELTGFTPDLTNSNSNSNSRAKFPSDHDAEHDQKTADMHKLETQWGSAIQVSPFYTRLGLKLADLILPLYVSHQAKIDRLSRQPRHSHHNLRCHRFQRRVWKRCKTLT